MKKRILSIILTLALCLSMLPTVSVPAAAAGTGKAIQFVDSGSAANISGGQADSIYFGTYQQSSDGSGGYHTDPIKWRVLSNASNQLFLLSDQNLDVFQYHTDEWEFAPPTVTWESSTMRSWLNGYGASSNKGDHGLGIDYSGNNFLDNAFSESKQGAIAETTDINDGNPYFTNVEAGNNTTDKVFLLSIAEVEDTSYFADSSSRIATNTAYVADGGEIKSTDISRGDGEAYYWWLRSLGGPKYYAADVTDNGSVAHSGLDMNHKDIAVRPAFNLNLNSVLFTSAADNTGHNSSFAAPTGYSGNEWKVTLKDSNDFSSGASVSGSTTLTVGYTATELTISHAAPSSFQNAGYTNVTAMLADENGSILYYGSINSNADATQSTVTIPAGLEEGYYTLSIYGEDWNGANLTDYATGTPFTTTITVHEHNWSADWSTNDTDHWHECQNSGCPVTENSGKDGYGHHNPTSDGGACVCGYHPITSVTVTGDKTTWNYAPDATATLTATVMPGDLSGATYAWTQNSAEVSGATNSTLTLSNLNAGTYTYTCTVTVDGYKKASETVTVTVNKADPTYTAPTDLTATYGQTLADVFSALQSGGTGDGSWKWTEATITPVGNVGQQTHKATLRPPIQTTIIP